MKKSLLTLSAAAIALSGMAASPKQQLQASVKPSFDKIAEVKPYGKLHVADRKASMKKAPSKVGVAGDVITSVEGTKQDVTITASGYYLYWGIVLDYYENEEIASHVVYGENNEVYVYDILPSFPNESYIKGVKDGDKVVFEFPQTVYWEDEYEDGYDLTMYDLTAYEEDGEMQLTYLPVEGTCSLTFKIAEDGSWTTDELSEEKILGAGLYSEGEAWLGYGAVDLSIVPFTEVAVSVPDDFELSKDFWAYHADEYGWPVSWAQGYDEVYFQGLSREMPYACVKGTVEYADDAATITIAPDQYLGMEYGYYLYVKFAKVIVDEDGYEDFVLMPDDYKYQLIWDYEEETLVAKDPEVSILYNASKTEAYYLTELSDVKLVHQESYEGIPQNPKDLVYDEGSYGYQEFNFTVPGLSTDGDVLIPDCLSYIVYVDGEEWEFDAEEYELSESIVEVPWDLSEYYIYNWGGANREVDFFVEGITTLGVQSIYRYNGEETRSEIVTIDLEGDPSGVAAIGAGKKVADVKYYDLSGRQVVNPAEGIFVKRVTFEDGTVATFKKAIR